MGSTCNGSDICDPTVRLSPPELYNPTLNKPGPLSIPVPFIIEFLLFAKQVEQYEPQESRSNTVSTSDLISLSHFIFRNYIFLEISRN